LSIDRYTVDIYIYRERVNKLLLKRYYLLSIIQQLFTCKATLNEVNSIYKISKIQNNNGANVPTMAKQKNNL